jgi:hypothetical protein
MMETLQRDDKKEAEDDINAWVNANRSGGGGGGKRTTTVSASPASQSASKASAQSPSSASSSASKKSVVWSAELTKERPFDSKLAPNTNRARLNEPANRRADPAHSILKGSSSSRGKQPAFNVGGVTIEELSDGDDEDDAEAKRIQLRALQAAHQKQQPQSQSQQKPATAATASSGAAKANAKRNDNGDEAAIFDPSVPRSQYLSQNELVRQIKAKIDAEIAAVETPAPAPPTQRTDIFDDADIDGASAGSSSTSSASIGSAGKAASSIPAVRQNAGKVEIQVQYAGSDAVSQSVGTTNSPHHCLSAPKIKIWLEIICGNSLLLCF